MTGRKPYEAPRVTDSGKWCPVCHSCSVTALVAGETYFVFTPQLTTHLCRVELDAPALERVRVASMRVGAIEQMVFGTLPAFVIACSTFPGFPAAGPTRNLTMVLVSTEPQPVTVWPHFGRPHT